MGKMIDYKVEYGNALYHTQSLKAHYPAIASYLARNGKDSRVKVYRGKKLYTTFALVDGKLVSLKSGLYEYSGYRDNGYGAMNEYPLPLKGDEDDE